MYVCPTCSKKFEEEEKLVKHFLSCWKQNNPNHISKEAPHSEDVETRDINEDMKKFFEGRIV